MSKAYLFAVILLAGGIIDCDAAKVIQLYMAKNTESGDWGYAAEGFRTTDGDYLEVIT